MTVPPASPAALPEGAQERAEKLGMAEKLGFLASPASYPAPCGKVEVIETHAAFVFLTETRAYKIKKPIRLRHMDCRALARREALCRAEFRVNQALAEGVYLDVAPLVRRAGGGLAIGGRGRVRDWLVVMKRLPRERFLDTLIDRGEEPDMHAVGRKLSAFYDRHRLDARAGPDYLEMLTREAAINRRHIRQMAGHLGAPVPQSLITRSRELLLGCRDEILGRGEAGQIVDGHGDLRPEHVCLTDPPVVFDRLEFDPSYRIVDPFDEMAFLGLECRLLGAPDIWPALLATLEEQGFIPPSDRLQRALGAFRMLLRARIALDHFRDRQLRTAERFRRQGRRYLSAAAELLEEDDPAAVRSSKAPTSASDTWGKLT